jgi:thymidylate synthase ThyX
MKMIEVHHKSGYGVRIIKDSIAEPTGKRITTWVQRIWRPILAEVNTHRDFSRNAASSRAIPIAKMIERIRQEPGMPVYWGKNQAGMQAAEELCGEELERAKEAWIEGREAAIKTAEKLLELKVHKQIANRVLEPWMITEQIITSTQFDNFFRQRKHKDAQPEFKVVADCLHEAMEVSKPQELLLNEWHLPYIEQEDVIEIGEAMIDIHRLPSSRVLARVASARCARVSYLQHDGTRSWEKDLELADKLIGPGHWSPFEHPARAMAKPERRANFVGWEQLRLFVDIHNFPDTASKFLGVMK